MAALFIQAAADLVAKIRKEMKSTVILEASFSGDAAGVFNQLKVRGTFKKCHIFLSFCVGISVTSVTYVTCHFCHLCHMSLLSPCLLYTSDAADE